MNTENTNTENPNMENTATAIDKAVAEAEQRGYLRGLNEAAARRMAEPTPFEAVPPEGGAPVEPDTTTDILTRQRRSIWD